MKKDIQYTNDDVFVLVQMLFSEYAPVENKSRLTQVCGKFRQVEFRDYAQKLIEAIGELRRRANNRITTKCTDDLRDFIYRTPFEEIPLWVGYEGSIDTKKEIAFFMRWRMKIGK